jgi:D-2-hydroxyacid dehydrogenase (NADP+)
VATLDKLVTVVDPRLEDRHIEWLRDQFPDLNVLKLSPQDDYEPSLEGAQAVVGRVLSPEIIATHPEIKWNHASGAGVETMMFKELVESDIIVTNNSGVHAQPISEYLVGMMLQFTRGFPELVLKQQRHFWERPANIQELGSHTVAVIGLGDIGHATALKLKAFGSRVLGCRRKADEPLEGVDEIYSPDRLHEMIAQADHVVITLPLTPRTRGMFGTEEFKVMKDTAIIYNIGRGAIIKQDELIEALNKGMIAGAGLDVTSPEPLPEDSPLWDTPGAFVTAHSCGSTPFYWDRGIEIVAENVRRFRNDEPLHNVVDKQEGY